MKNIGTVELPMPGQTRFYDRSTGIEQILLMVSTEEHRVQSISIDCATGGGVGKVLTPIVSKIDRGYKVEGTLTATGEKAEFVYYTQHEFEEVRHVCQCHWQDHPENEWDYVYKTMEVRNENPLTSISSLTVLA